MRNQKQLTLGSLFTGIGGFDLGFERAGVDIRWQVEIEKFCREVLEFQWPKVKRLNDITRCKGSTSSARASRARMSVLPASAPGSRAGHALNSFTILRGSCASFRPDWFVFENVPGLFSSHHGRDFAEVLRVLMVECGYGVCWRVLNSRYFGVAQRRRRMFIVGCFGKPCPPEILFEPTRGGGHPSPGRETRESLAGSLGGGAYGTGRRSEDDPNIVSNTVTTRWGKGVRGREGQETQNIVQQAISCKWAKGSSGPAGDEHHNLIVVASLRESDGHHGRSSPRGDGQDNIVCSIQGLGDGGPDHSAAQAGHIVIQDVRGGTRDKTDAGQGIGITEGGPCYTLSKTEQHAVAFAENQRGEIRTSDIAPQLSAGGGKPGSGYPAVALPLPSEHRGVGQGHNTNYVSSSPDSNRVRSFARLPKGLDSARYRALGNAVTVQVAEWIAKRIVAYEKKEKLNARNVPGLR